MQPKPSRERPGFLARPSTILFATVRPALIELTKAHNYARLAQRDPWDFAIKKGCLQALGATETDLRWLVCMEYVHHAREITQTDDGARGFQPSNNAMFGKRTCFILTEKGASLVRNLDEQIEPHGQSSGDVPRQLGLAPRRALGDMVPASQIPKWDMDRHELRYSGRLVKQFKWPAVNQETILAVFDEEGWPPRIDDPLPPKTEQDSKRRLHDTIKCLNKNQKHNLIRFRGDGTGEGVLWMLVADEAGDKC